MPQIDSNTRINIKITNLNLLNTLPTNVLSLPKGLPPLGYHLPRPNFSVSFQSLSLKLLNLGSPVLIFRRDLWKNPSFFVWKLGYPLLFFVLAAAHVMLFELGPGAKPLI